MFKVRVIPCLDVKDGRVVKGVNFVNLRDAGDPVEAAIAYDEAGADELTFLDITASHEDRDIMLDVVQRFIRAWTYTEMPWREAQDAGLLWAPLRKPHENALDEHWLKRKSFADVPHPEHGRSFRYPTSKWLSTATSWQVG